MELETKEITLSVKNGEAVFLINDIDPFRVQALLNTLSRLLNLGSIIDLVNLVRTKEGRNVAKAIPGVLSVLQSADEKVLERVVEVLLHSPGCKWRKVGADGWKDYDKAATSLLFTSKLPSLYKLLYFAMDVNLRPLVEELKSLLPQDPPSSEEAQSPSP